MKALIYHPITLVSFAFALVIGAWSVIITAAVNNRAKSIPVEAPAKAHNR